MRATLSPEVIDSSGVLISDFARDLHVEGTGQLMREALRVSALETALEQGAVLKLSPAIAISDFIAEASQLLDRLDSLSSFDRSKQAFDTFTSRRMRYGRQEYGFLSTLVTPASPELIAEASKNYFRDQIIPVLQRNYYLEPNPLPEFQRLEEIVLHFILNRLTIPSDATISKVRVAPLDYDSEESAEVQKRNAVVVARFHELYENLPSDLRQVFSGLSQRHLMDSGGLLHDHIAYRVELLQLAETINQYFSIKNSLLRITNAFQLQEVDSAHSAELELLRSRIGIHEYSIEAEFFSELRGKETASVTKAFTSFQIPTLDPEVIEATALRLLTGTDSNRYYSYCGATVLIRSRNPKYIALLAMESLHIPAHSKPSLLLTGNIQGDGVSLMAEYLRGLNRNLSPTQKLELDELSQALLKDCDRESYSLYQIISNSSVTTAESHHPLRKIAEEGARKMLLAGNVDEQRYALDVLAFLPGALGADTNAVLLDRFRELTGSELAKEFLPVARSHVGNTEPALVPILLSALPTTKVEKNPNLARSRENSNQDESDAAKILVASSELLDSEYVRLTNVLPYTVPELKKAHALLRLSDKAGLTDLIGRDLSHSTKLDRYVEAARSSHSIKVAQALQAYRYSFELSHVALLNALEPKIADVVAEFSKHKGSVLGSSCHLSRLSSLYKLSPEQQAALCDPVIISYLEDPVKTQSSALSTLIYFNAIRENLKIDPIPAFRKAVQAKAANRRSEKIEGGEPQDFQRFEAGLASLLQYFTGSVVGHPLQGNDLAWDKTLERALKDPTLLENYCANVRSGRSETYLNVLENLVTDGSLRKFELEEVRQTLLTIAPQTLEMLWQGTSPQFLALVVGRLAPILDAKDLNSLAQSTKNFSHIATDPVLLKSVAELASGNCAPLLAASFMYIPKLSREDHRLLAPTLQTISTIAESKVQSTLLSKLKNSEFKDFTGFRSCVEELVIERLSGIYPKRLIRKCTSEQLLNFAQHYLPFEQRLGTNAERVNLRIAAAAELRGKSHELHRGNSRFLNSLHRYPSANIVDTHERESALENLTERRKMWESHSALKNLSTEQRRAWCNNARPYHHILAETTVEDQIVSLSSALDASFRFGHISEASIELLSLQDGARRLSELSAAWRNQAANIKTAKSDSTPAQALQVLRLELQEIEVEQAKLKEWHQFRSLGERYSERLSHALQDLKLKRRELAEYAAEVDLLGFDFQDSFGEKIFRGELKILKAAIQKLDLADEEKNRRLQLAMEVVNQIEMQHALIQSYLSNVVSIVGRTLPLFEAKRERLQKVKAEVASSDNPLRVLQDAEPDLFRWAQRTGKFDTSNSHSPLSEQVLNILELACDHDAIADLQSIEALLEPEGPDGSTILSYRAVSIFSEILSGTVGQCLDFRTGANSRHLLACTEPHIEMVVARDEYRIPRVNGMLFLAHTDDKNLGPVVLVMDAVYTADGTPLSWSKIEGQIRFAFERSVSTQVPLVIPSSVATHYCEQLSELAKSLPSDIEARSIPLTISPGPHGSMYCELEGFTTYSHEQIVNVEAWILNPKS